jgi:hypothetical protein
MEEPACRNPTVKHGGTGSDMTAISCSYAAKYLIYRNNSVKQCYWISAHTRIRR